MSFQELWREAVKDPVNADFRKLRSAYADSDQYDPYGRDAEEMLKINRLLRGGHFNDANAKFPQAIEHDPLNLQLHAMAAYCYKKMGQREMSEREERIYCGLIDSVFSSGDGTSPEKAVKVLDTREEYTLLSILRLEFLGQSLVEKNGRKFDRMLCRRIADGKQLTVYFDVSMPMNWIGRKLSTPRETA